MIKARIYLARHGETDWNVKGLIQGQTDIPLNDQGRIQSALLGKGLKDIPFRTVFTSDLSRAVETAEIVIRHQPEKRQSEITLVKEVALRERYMAEWEGQSRPKGKMPSTVETADALAQRGVTWWAETFLPHVLSTVAEEDARTRQASLGPSPSTTNLEPVIATGQSESDWEDEVPAFLVVTHGAFLNALVQGLVRMAGNVLDAGKGYNVGSLFNTAVVIIEMLEDGKGVLTKFGDLSHLIQKVIEVNNADEL